MSDQSSGKTKQSHLHSLRSDVLLKRKANSLAHSRRSGDCSKLKVCRKMVVNASWYGPGFHGRETKCHDVYNQNGLTAASNTLSCDTKVHLFNKKTGKSVIVRINDTGGFARYKRDIDLSMGAAIQLGMKDDGHAHLEMEVVYKPPKNSKT